MGSSAQNSSGVHWCRRRVRFNKVPEKVQKVPEKVWEAWCGSRSGSTGFRKKFRRRWEALVQSQVRFNRVPEKIPEKVPGSLGAKPSQVQQISGEGCREDRGEGFGNLWCRARSSSTGSGEGCRQGVSGEPHQCWFRRRLQRKFCKNKTVRLLGIPPRLILSNLLNIAMGQDLY